jgi:hypothetical protein
MTPPASRWRSDRSPSLAEIGPFRLSCVLEPARPLGTRRRGPAPSRDDRPSSQRRTFALGCRWLALCVLSGAAASLAAVLALGMPRPKPASPPLIVRQGPEGLPLVAQGVVSAALGGDSRAYQVVGLRAINPAQRLQMRFSAQGVEIASGRARVRLKLVAYGRGRALGTPGPARLGVRDNRVSYVYGRFAEWFANGPRGLEQGFDIAGPPRGERGPLTFALALSGAIHARLRRGAVLLNGDGASLRYAGLVATDARGRALNSWLALAGRRVLIRVDDRGARYPLRVDPFVEQGELSDKAGAPGEEFGEAIAVSGRTLVVGTIQHMAASSGIEPGAAYVFTAPASGWAHAHQAAILHAPRGQAEEEFGRSVAISGNTIVVGAPFHEVGKHPGQGAAYVFVEPASGWRTATATAKLTAAGGAANEFFGESVAISGDTVVVGAPGRKVGGHVAQGAVDLFAVPRPRAGAARQLAALTSPHGQAGDALGISVAISGPTIVAGADLHQVGTTAEQGAAYIFTKRTAGWSSARETAQLTDQRGEARELFGRTVAIWQNTVVVGAPDRGGVNTRQGAAYVFVKPSSGWSGSVTQTAELTASDPGKGDQFGGALAVSGALIVAGAQSHATGKKAEQGAGYVFVKPPTGWRTTTETGELLVTRGAEGDKLGRSVALSGNTILLSAPDRAVDRVLAQGAVFAYQGHS